MATTGTKLSAIATAQTLALTKGPNSGTSQPTGAAILHILDDSIVLPVDHTVTHQDTIALGAEFIKFGKVPKGARIIPSLSRLTSNHSAAVAGALWLVPLSGATPTVIASVTVQLETLTVAHNSTSMDVADQSFLDNAATATATEDSWVCFWPVADLVVASSEKTFWARIVYALKY